MSRLKIGEILMANGLISKDQLDDALSVQEKQGGLLGMILVNLQYIKPDTLTQYLEAQNR
ncbi:MAG: hypothetical protein GY754_20225 [bacterium]|nr:hypothetical protein [bacterium]